MQTTQVTRRRHKEQAKGTAARGISLDVAFKGGHGRQKPQDRCWLGEWEGWRVRRSASGRDLQGSCGLYRRTGETHWFPCGQHAKRVWGQHFSECMASRAGAARASPTSSHSASESGGQCSTRPTPGGMRGTPPPPEESAVATLFSC